MGTRHKGQNVMYMKKCNVSELDSFKEDIGSFDQNSLHVILTHLINLAR